MKNLKNKFIFGIILLIVLIIASQVYRVLGADRRDVSSYATLIEGQGFLNEVTLSVQQKTKLKTGDKLKTGSGLIIIEWGEGSITRLGKDTELLIREESVSQNLREIRIATELLSGKSWSRIVTTLEENSYFKQYFDDIEAGVRGTTFDIDLNSKTVFVQNHEIELKDKKGNLVIIPENQAFSLSSFSFIDIQKYVSEIQDITWKNLNNTLDSKEREKMIELMKTELDRNTFYLTFLEIFFPKYRVFSEIQRGGTKETIQPLIANLSQAQKEELYNEMYEEYQSLHQISFEEEALYKKKLLYKDILIMITPSETVKKNMVKGSMNDMQDILMSGKIAGFQDTLNFIKANTDIVDTLPESAKDIFNSIQLDILPQDLKDILKENALDLGTLFLFDPKEFNLSLDGIQEINNTLQNTIHTGLDSVYDKASNLFQNK